MRRLAISTDSVTHTAVEGSLHGLAVVLLLSTRSRQGRRGVVDVPKRTVA